MTRTLLMVVHTLALISNLEGLIELLAGRPLTPHRIFWVYIAVLCYGLVLLAYTWACPMALLRPPQGGPLMPPTHRWRPSALPSCVICRVLATLPGRTTDDALRALRQAALMRCQCPGVRHRALLKHPHVVAGCVGYGEEEA